MNNEIKLDEINFDTPIELIMKENEIPEKFKQCSFESYIADKDYPSQQQAKEELYEFILKVSEFNKKKCCKSTLNKLFKINKKPKNIYLDGGFGIGKTHLLASIGNAYKGKSLFLSFSELMYLIAYFDLLPTVERLSKFDIILLDEFELDDPGDAMMGINFIRELNKTDSLIVTTSNTTPTELGGRKFDIMVFKKRIGVLINYFHTIEIDGKDYRIKKVKKIEYDNGKKNLETIFREYRPKKRKKLFLTFDELLNKMKEVHPARYINFNTNIDAIFIKDLRQFTDDELLSALRFTYLVDILYYGAVDIFISTDIDIWNLFSDDLKDGKFKNKVMRCVSRMTEKGTFINLSK